MKSSVRIFDIVITALIALLSMFAQSDGSLDTLAVGEIPLSPGAANKT